ncbi:MAG: hypothetical protein RSD97_02465 [Lachnospiraceae bacterium]
MGITTEINEIDKMVIGRLSSVAKKKEFIKHVFCMLKSKEQKEQMIAFIDKNKALTEMDVMEKMLRITL